MESYRVELGGKLYTGMGNKIEIKNNRLYVDGVLQVPDDDKEKAKTHERKANHDHNKR